MRRSSPIWVGALALSTLVACNSAGSTTDQSVVSGGTFTYALSGDPANLDPAHAVAPEERIAINFAYESLVSVKPDGELVPFIAESWEVSRTEVTYKIRDDVTCADGSKMTPSLVAKNLNYHADPDHASFYLGSQITKDTVATADDEAGTVTVKQDKPNPFLLPNTGTVYMMCPKALKDPKSMTRKTDGTGLYQLTKAVSQDRYTFTKRDDYTWGPGGVTSKTKGLPDKVVIRVIADENTRANLLLSGEVTAAEVSGPNRDRVEAQGLFSVSDRNPTGEMLFNEAKGKVFSDPLVREALVTALDRQKIATVLTDGKGKKPVSLTTSAPFACVADKAPWTLPETDLAKAGRLLDEAGWVKGPDGMRSKNGKPLQVDFVYDQGGETFPDAAELVASSWKKLGVETKLRELNSAGWDDVLFSTGDWDTGFVLIIAGYPSFFTQFYDGAPPPKGNNFMHVDNPEYDKLAAKASTATQEDTCKIWQQAEKALVERFDVVPIVDAMEPTFANGAKFELAGFITPTSIRMQG